MKLNSLYNFFKNEVFYINRSITGKGTLKTLKLLRTNVSKRNLYTNAIDKSKKIISRKILDFLQYCDGRNDLYQIAKNIKLNYSQSKKIYSLLKRKNLIF